MTSTLICISSGSSKIKKLSWQWGRRWHDGTKAEMGGNDLIWCAYHRTWGKGTGREEADTASRCGEWGRSHSLVFITIDHQLLVRGRNEEEGRGWRRGGRQASHLLGRCMKNHFAVQRSTSTQTRALLSLLI